MPTGAEAEDAPLRGGQDTEAAGEAMHVAAQTAVGGRSRPAGDRRTPRPPRPSGPLSIRPPRQAACVQCWASDPFLLASVRRPLADGSPAQDLFPGPARFNRATGRSGQGAEAVV